MALRLPSPDQLDEPRAEAVLRELRFPVPAGRPGWAAPVFAVVPGLRDLVHEPVVTFALGEERVRHRIAGPITADTLVCSCGGRACVHIAAALLVVAFNDPVRRSVFEGPAWEIALAPLLGPAEGLPPAPARFRYLLRAPAPGRVGLELEPRLVRTDASGRETEARFPRTPGELRQIPGATDADAALLDAWNALEQARRSKSAVLVRHLSRQVLSWLARVPDVRLDGALVQVSAASITPVLRAVGAADTDLALAFEPAIRLHWADAGVVMTEAGVVAALSDQVRPEVAARLTAPLPVVPRAEVRRFVARMVVDQGLAVALPGWLDPVGPAEARSARITLSEDGSSLRVTLALTYERGGARAVVDPLDPAATVRIPGGGIARRDRGWEQAETVRFTGEVGGPLELSGNEAYNWLADVLPTLVGRWSVDGEERLVRHRVRGTLSPRVRFTEGTDWFDLDVRFTLGEAPAAGVEVVHSWLTGQRWHHLDDGGVAALPTRWLERHGRTVDTLAEVRRAQRGLGTWHAWTASDLLLEEVGAPAERWLGWVRSTARDGVARREVPAGFVGALRTYQQQGFEWLCFLRDHGLHGLLADEMGLGKTVQALAFLLDTPRDAPALVIAPTSVLHNWLDEARRFAPSLRLVAWHGPDRKRDQLDDADVVVTTYALLRRDVALLSGRAWSTVVVDEGQNLKNPASQTARAARRLRARHRLVLSGTPIENDLVELWSLFQFLMPGYLGRRSAFHARYQVASRDPDAPALADLARRIRPFVLRRRKRDVAKELPPRTDVVLRVSLSDRERHLYELVRNTVREAASAPRGDDRHRSAAVLEGLTRLRQACCHPALLPFPEARPVTRSAKLEALVQELDTALPAGARCLVFSQWVRLLDEVALVLQARGVPFARLDGGTVDRAGVVRAFQADDGPPVLLVSVKAGGTGLNLTAADRVYLLDPWWNPAVEDQAADRAHRLGQQRPVTVVRLVAADTIEDRVLALQEKKRRLFDETVDGPTLDVSALGTVDLLALLEP